jgi:hypothetical protein
MAITRTQDRLPGDEVMHLQAAVADPQRAATVVSLMFLWVSRILVRRVMQSDERSITLPQSPANRDLRLIAVKKSCISFAIKSGDGSSIRVADGGSTRILSVDEVKSAQSAQEWFWSLEPLDLVVWKATTRRSLLRSLSRMSTVDLTEALQL